MEAMEATSSSEDEELTDDIPLLEHVQRKIREGERLDPVIQIIADIFTKFR